MLMRAGEAELFTGQPLTTDQCLAFLCDLPRDSLPVGFAFGYDVTMILRDVPPDRLKRIFADKEVGPGKSRYTWHGLYGIEYLPKNYFRVCRVRRIWRTDPVTGQRYETVQTIPGTNRTVWETFGFFQKSFLKAIDAFGVATPAEVEVIETMKAARGHFDTDLTPEIRQYCGLECDLLARMMTVFRQLCLDVDIRPRTWNGAGKLSAALHTKYDTLTAERLAELVPPPVLTMASAAYYGGRFEIARVGNVGGPVYEYDIHSAYPAAMTRLPCLEHGTWHEASAAWLRKPPPGATYVASVAFQHKPPETGRLAWCGLPVRLKTGRIIWPQQGQGTYWGCEIEAAAKLGCNVRHHGGWRLESTCQCQQFSWLGQLYEYRKSLGGSLKGEPIKYGINGSYGKLAQRIGQPRWANLIWAGLITAMTRAQLIDAVALDPEAVVMLATDGVIATRPLALPVADSLGAWEATEHERLFVVQPGVYWGAKRPKTRGVNPSFFETRTAAFEQAWGRYQGRGGTGDPPSVELPLRLFVGLKLALSRGKPETGGRWIEQQRQISFDWTVKRGRGFWDNCNGLVSLWTYPPAGGPDLISRPHKGDEALTAELDLTKAELDDQPDYVDLSPPIDRG